MMAFETALTAGAAIGLLVAVPVGPMGILCIQRTLHFGRPIGISTGLGGATMNVACGAGMIFGLDRLAPAVDGSGTALNLLGGLFLIWSAIRLVLRRRILAAGQAERPPSLLRAYVSALAVNATNPMAPIVMAALLAPMIAGSPPTLLTSVCILLGMFGTVAVWWICVCGAVDLLRAKVTPAVLLGVNRTAAIGLIVYGTLALARALG